MAHHRLEPGTRLAAALAAGTLNRFGLARLALATTVIVSHAPYLLDGSQHREPLFALTGQITFGELAVLGFFFVSGVLVTANYATTPNLAQFCRKRAARILPGFAAAYLMTLFVAGPLTGGTLATLLGQPGLEAAARLVLLQPPTLQGAFHGAPDPRMNNAMWTIPYEVACYLVTAILGAAALLHAPRVQLWLLCLVTLLVLTEPWQALPPETQAMLGNPRQAVRLLQTFLIGAGFFHHRARIVLHGPAAALAAIAYAGMVFVPGLLFSVAPICGGYALLWLVFAGRPGLIGSIGLQTDISYGLYLYGWPVQNALVCLMPGLQPWTLAFATLPIAAAAAYLSWIAVERPAMRHSRQAAPIPLAPTAG